MTLYRCPTCGHTEQLDPSDWQETLPACPVELYDPVNDEMSGTMNCPDSFMVPMPDAEERER